MSEIETQSVTVPLTLANIPHHPVWEADGSCWRTIEWPNEAGWRWQPMNWTAFAKEDPEGEMHDTPPRKFSSQTAPWR